jgi:nitrogen fixation-related uncharacterized protein
MNARPQASRARRLVTWLLAVVILVPALYGFGSKFAEFLQLVGNEEGAFTVVPVLNYLLASAGFLLLLLWAIGHGMFRDVEGPKHAMLQRERLLDEEARAQENERGEP